MAANENIIRIIFDGDVVVTVRGDLQEIQENLVDAIRDEGWLVIRPDEGPTVSINPRQVRYMEEVVTPAEATRQKNAAQKNGAAQKSAPARRARPRQTTAA